VNPLLQVQKALSVLPTGPEACCPPGQTSQLRRSPTDGTDLKVPAGHAEST
jgi:hypothetical protein